MFWVMAAVKATSGRTNSWAERLGFLLEDRNPANDFVKRLGRKFRETTDRFEQDAFGGANGHCAPACGDAC